VLVVNLHAEEPACSALIDRIAAAFDGDVQVLAAEAGGNRVVFAGRCAEFRDCNANFKARWTALPIAHRQTLRISVSRFARSRQWHALARSPRVAPKPFGLRSTVYRSGRSSSRSS